MGCSRSGAFSAARRIFKGKGGMNQKGLTLIELILALLGFAILAGAIAPFFSTAGKAFHFVEEETDLRYESKFALETMVNEIRQAESFSEVRIAKLKFKKPNGDTVQFQQEGRVLEHNSGTLASNLSPSNGLDLTYFDTAGNVTNDKDEVKMVRIVLTLTTSDKTLTQSVLARSRY
jgi:Tfp pilus assembly protein PilE